MSTSARIVLILVGILLMICIGCSVIVIWERIKSQREDQRILTDVASKLGVPPEWVNVREYLYCHLLQPDMTVAEVDEELKKVGEYYPTEPPSQQILFINDHIEGALGPIYLDYDKQNRLINISISEYNKGPLSSCEKEWMATRMAPGK